MPYFGVSCLLRWPMLCLWSVFLSTFCDETSKNWTSLNPKTSCVISIKRPWVQVLIWVAQFHSLLALDPAPAHQPICTSTETPQTKQLTRLGLSPTHQQARCLKIPWAYRHTRTWPCPPEGPGPDPLQQWTCISPRTSRALQSEIPDQAPPTSGKAQALGLALHLSRRYQP